MDFQTLSANTNLSFDQIVDNLNARNLALESNPNYWGRSTTDLNPLDSLILDRALTLGAGVHKVDTGWIQVSFERNYLDVTWSNSKIGHEYHFASKSLEPILLRFEKNTCGNYKIFSVYAGVHPSAIYFTDVQRYNQPKNISQARDIILELVRYTKGTGTSAAKLPNYQSYEH